MDVTDVEEHSAKALSPQDLQPLHQVLGEVIVVVEERWATHHRHPSFSPVKLSNF